RSLTERWHKWRRRRPYAYTVGMLLLAVLTATLAAGAVTVAHAYRQLEEAQKALVEGRQQLDRGHEEEAVSALKRRLDLAQGWPGGGDLVRELKHELARAGRAREAALIARAARELHGIADDLRFLYGADAVPRGRLREAEARSRAFWDKRGLILESLGT